MRRVYLLWFALLISAVLFAQKQTKVACVGNRITYGSRLTHPEQDSYSAQLQRLLGDKYAMSLVTSASPGLPASTFRAE